MKTKKLNKSHQFWSMLRATIMPKKLLTLFTITFALMFSSVYAAQTGAIKGTVISSAGETVDGVEITASSNVLPKARTTVTKNGGDFNLPLLLPGIYQLTFKPSSGNEETITVEVLLNQTSNIEFTLGQSQKKSDNVLVVTGARIIQEHDSGLSTSLGEKVVEGVPTGQNYRDMLKLIPGVAYSELGVLGPNAGGSGRDNKYGIDGVDVSLPLFGNLSAEPSTQDIANIAIDRGAAKAIGFNRSGGFAINTISKSGTNEFHANVGITLQDKSFVANKDDADNTKFTLDQNWIKGSVSGPIIKDELFFYGSYYRPYVTRQNKETAYGPAKNFKSTRNEYFGKLTYQPISDLLLNGSYRTSKRNGRGESVGAFDADSTSSGSDATQDILTLDGSYFINDDTTIYVQYGTFDFNTKSSPDTIFGFQPTVGDNLDLNNLDQLGAFNVPDRALAGTDPVALSLIERFGYIDENGIRQGGGQIGGASTINLQNFSRDSFEFKLDHEMYVGDVSHRLHFGFQWKKGTEELSRLSNGWGSISYLGGIDLASDGVTPIFYRAITQQQSLIDANGAAIPFIVSGTRSYNLEFNDVIEYGDFTYNLGLLMSQDTLYGQGLKKNSANVSGFELAPGNKYKMHTMKWGDMIQPRLGVTWNYSDLDTVFVHFARYNPEASSLARAASWARNTRRSLNVDFDQNGNLIEVTGRRGSSGKFFQAGIKPRQITEFTIGTTKAITDQWYLRAHLRRREGKHFWEDAPNNARLRTYTSPFGNGQGGAPADIAALGLYIPELDDYRAEVGGSSFVIAELDKSYTTYNEFSLEATYKGERTYLNLSYVRSNYKGNFDQDSVSSNSDRNLFIGSSLLADGAGRFTWDGKKGRLFGDRPNVFKAFGYYTTDWDANLGFYFVFQSGDVWEAWNGRPYGFGSSTIRFIEPAGSRRSPSHWQLDLNYTQDFEIANDYVLQFRADLFNVFDNQTGYRYNPFVTSSTFGQPRSLINPRRLQLAVNLEF